MSHVAYNVSRFKAEVEALALTLLRHRSFISFYFLFLLVD